MKKTLVSLSIVSLLMLGCSPKKVNVPVPVSVNKNTKKVDFAIMVRFNEAVEFQNHRNYAEAIKIYNSIINYYRGKEDKGILSSAYINKFECSLVSNRGYSKNNIKDFLRRFSRNSQEMMEFEVLYILDGGKRKSMDAEIERWSSKYSNQQLNDWTFKYIDDWIRRLEDANARNRLNRYVAIFKKSL